MDAIGGLFATLAGTVVGLFAGAVRAFGDAVQGVFGIFQSILPGVLLPIVGVAVLLVVGWNLIKR